MSGSLTHSQAQIIRQLLVDQSLGSSPPTSGVVTAAWPIYVSQEPNTPDSVITLYDTVGTDQGRNQISGETFENHGFQVRVRAGDYQTAFQKARAIAVAFDEDVWNETVTVDSSVYAVNAITRASGPLSLGKATPESKNDLFTLNAVVALRQIT